MPNRFNPRREKSVEAPDPSTIDSPGSVNARAQGASLIQYQIEMGASKNLLSAMWFSSFIAALAVIGLVAVGFAYFFNSAHVNVLQYDLDRMRTQLEAQGLYEPTGH